MPKGELCKKCSAQLTPKSPYCDNCGAETKYFKPPKGPRVGGSGVVGKAVALFLLLVLLFSSCLVAVAYYWPHYISIAGISEGPVAISHVPLGSVYTVGDPLTLQATVTGADLNTVTLKYSLLKRAPDGNGVTIGGLVSVPMLLAASGGNTYSYTIPASEMSGIGLRYEILASDTYGRIVTTDTYILSMADFGWNTDITDEVTVTRAVPAQVTLSLISVNGFNQPVTLRVIGSTMAGVSIVPANSQITPPNDVILTVTSTSDATISEKQQVEIDAVYTSGSSSVQITHSTVLVLTLTDFSISISSAYQTAKTCSDVSVCSTYDAPYTVTVVAYRGFSAPNGINMSLSGLPTHTSWQMILATNEIAADGTETLTYTLRIHVDRGLTGLPQQYALVLTGTAYCQGGTIAHTASFTLYIAS